MSHTVAIKEWMSKVAAGWHICLVVAEHMLDGSPIGRIVGSEAKIFGWKRLDVAYAAKLGVAGTGLARRSVRGEDGIEVVKVCAKLSAVASWASTLARNAATRLARLSASPAWHIQSSSP